MTKRQRQLWQGRKLKVKEFCFPERNMMMHRQPKSRLLECWKIRIKMKNRNARDVFEVIKCVNFFPGWWHSVRLLNLDLHELLNLFFTDVFIVCGRSISFLSFMAKRSKSSYYRSRHWIIFRTQCGIFRGFPVSHGPELFRAGYSHKKQQTSFRHSHLLKFVQLDLWHSMLKPADRKAVHL